MSDSSVALQELAQEIATGDLSSAAPTMGRLQKISYSHEAMIDLIIAKPGISQNELAATFGYSPGWISNMLAADAFQARLAARRAELIDPSLVATIEERFKGLTLQSLARLQEKLDKPQVSDSTVLKALELGAKAMGVGGNAAPRPQVVDLGSLRDRLIELRGDAYGAKTVEGTATRVEESR